MTKRLAYYLILSLFVSLLLGCTAKTNDYMLVKEPKKQYFPSPDKALFIVERNNDFIGHLYNMVLWDITDRRDPKLVGYLRPTMKAAYEMTPGEKEILLTWVSSTTMMKMTVEAGKTYFCRIGSSSSRPAFFPIKNGDANDVTRDNIAVATPHLIAWGNEKERKEVSLQKRIGKGMSRWNQMSTKDKVLRSMVAEDGR